MGVVVLPQPTLPDYIGCDSDADCPVGLGRCLSEVAYSVPDATGATSVTLRSLGLTGAHEGVCTLPCTDDASICSRLWLELGDRGPAPFACQIVARGVSPYPDSPGAYPLAVDLDAMSAGEAFAAICRPPFEITDDHSDALCTACTEDSACGLGDLCWNSGTASRGDSSASGECLESCEGAEDCAFGFTCEALQEATGDGPNALGTYCVPTIHTCGACLDVDGDGRGTGLCASGGTASSPVDCDDAEPEAYYDPANPAHPFPTYCGQFDMNCNGEADEDEQLVSADHCGGCGQECRGSLASGAESAQRECQPGGTCGLSCDSPTTQADCDGDLANGCEVRIDDPSRLVYLDQDGDGDGTDQVVASPQSPLFTCTPGDTPTGYSLSSTDCDDDEPSISGEFGDDTQCDGVDQDCDGAADSGYVPIACSTGQFGMCAAGTTVCSAGETTCNANLSPAADTCLNRGTDDDCDGLTNDLETSSGAQVIEGAPCTATAATGSCQMGTWGCPSSGAAAICLPGGPSPDTFGDGVDQNCDGVDGDASNTVYVSPSGSDSAAGTPTSPLATIELAISRARSSGKRLVRAAGGVYAEPDLFIVSSRVTVIGGHVPSQGWQLGSTRTTVTVSGSHVPAIDATVGLFCVADSDTSANRGGFTGVDILVERRTSGATGENVVGAMLRDCGWIRFSDSSLTVADGADGAASTAVGATGTTGGRGSTGGRGIRGSGELGAPGVSGGTSGCSRTGGRSGAGGESLLSTSSVTRIRGKDGSNGSVSGGGGGGGGIGGRVSPVSARPGGAGLPGAASTIGGGAGAAGRLGGTSIAGLFGDAARRGGVGAAGNHGHGGGGGGGGAAGQLVGSSLTVSGSAGGGGGGGGCGGGGGDGGQAGGNSVGVVVQTSSVTLTGLRIIVGNGGQGGAGASGGSGGGGGAAGPGGAAVDTAGSGGSGGTGGSGSGGGGGGGGGGGRSIGVVRTSSTFSYGSPSFVLGVNGAGGSGGPGGAGGTGGTASVSGARGRDGVGGGGPSSFLTVSP